MLINILAHAILSFAFPCCVWSILQQMVLYTLNNLLFGGRRFVKGA